MAKPLTFLSDGVQAWSCLMVNKLIALATAKLINDPNLKFNAQDIHQVFAVVAQRFCLNPVLAGTEAIELAD